MNRWASSRLMKCGSTCCRRTVARYPRFRYIHSLLLQRRFKALDLGLRQGARRRNEGYSLLLKRWLVDEDLYLAGGDDSVHMRIGIEVTSKAR